jgi:stage V sporulation protein B
LKRPDVRAGTAYILVAQLFFLVSGYILHVFLGRYLGPAEYGVFGVVLYAATMIRTFVMSGIPMSVARYVSAEPHRADAILRQGLKLQLYIAGTVSLIFLLISKPLATLLGDASLAPLFMIAAPITIFFGIFFIFNQYHNGLGEYKLQALWLIISYFLRAVLCIGLTWIGWRVYGAVTGLTLAAVGSCLVFFFHRRQETTTESYPAKILINFGAPLILASIVQALITDMDMMFVKGMIKDSSSAGFYTSAKAMAQSTPFAFYALSSALYPAISRTQAEGNMEKMRTYIHQANRLLLMAILPLLVIVCLNSQAILQMMYGKRYLPAAEPLSLLMISFSLMSIFIIHRTFITGSGHPKTSSLLTLALLPVCIISNLILIPQFGLSGAAYASIITFLAGSIGAGIIVFVKFRAGFEWRSSLNIIIAATVILITNRLLSTLGMPIILSIALLGSVYLGMLWLLGEWKISKIRELIGQWVS